MTRWGYVAAAAACAAVAVAALTWRTAPPGAPAQSVAPPPVAREGAAGSEPIAVVPVTAPQPEAKVAPPVMTKTEVVKHFQAAIQQAREAPAKPPPPEIAQAKSFQEAFAAMKRAQAREEAPAAPEAALNPFGAPRAGAAP